MNLGEYYGYPQCCIEFYEKNRAPYWFRPYQVKYPKAFRKLDGSGFIPCEAHLKEIEEGKDPIELIANRHSPAPFPLGVEELTGIFLGLLVEKCGIEDSTLILINLIQQGEKGCFPLPNTP
jgi:hypothetical protein